ncbi:UNVERIFIED_CONTAM: hypothetical protein NCL1_36687 [Trichonephila clavipes]
MEAFFTQWQTCKLRHFHDFFLLNFIVIVQKDFKVLITNLNYCPKNRTLGGFVFKMSRKKLFKTDEEAVEYLFSEELESKMIALPPEVDELTDEEGFDDTEALDLSVRDIAVSIKIYVPYENHDDHRETDLSNKSKKRSCSESGSNTRKKSIKELIADWKKVPPNYIILLMKVMPQK